MKRLISIGIILLFIGMSISSSTGFNAVEQSNTPLNGKTLYVGGSGPGNYTKIQDAIDNTSDGDTVFVYNGTYFENVVVNKSINLIGEDRNSTVIDGMGKSESILLITVNNITIKYFKIQNSSSINGVYAGIYIRKDIENIIIDNNIIQNNFRGIFVHFNNRDITIINNLIFSNHVGIRIQGINSKIFNNSIIDNDWGIDLLSIGDTIVGNTISGSTYGIILTGGGFFCNIISNNISNNQIGVQLYTSSSNKFKRNNFIGNEISVRFEIDIPFFINRWLGNYWDDIGNKKIYVIKGIWNFFWLNPMYPKEIIWYYFDFFPAQEPYDIEV
jgi:parallel beta-helix repeat protein